MWGAFVNLITSLIDNLHNVTGSWGLAIILFTVLIKLVTWPLNSKQVRSQKAQQKLQPKMKALQEKYKDDRESLAREQMALYQKEGVNPLSGCFPMLIQLPIWFALYRAIFSLAQDGRLGEGFLWIPNLADPGATFRGLAWVLDFANYSQYWPYLVLPIVTMISQVLISRMMMSATPTMGGDDPTANMMKQMNTIMPVMFGFFALQFPAGLALYWVTNNVLTGIQYYILNRTEEVEGATVDETVLENPVLETAVVDGSVRALEESANGRATTSRPRKKRRIKR
ncbi:MAG: YidC/Oxa1 family membrane protein insertase [Anaerolineales bacterium]|nr:YidC/Oxa1 family membrane protein insertase [Anaerolineales bacterium]MCB9126424.1 YidC/Oxa1 family membrane protein insertase [Ardenticatenales bacterium]MCB9171585.1 YidC/Oxa1 family membrane protein insertase [Ardenticatenales bacterium]